jgi:hypothetical protein
MRKKFAVSTLVVVAAIVALAACSSITSPLAATANPVGSKIGEAKVSLLFGTIPLKNKQDGGVYAAARNGGITRISTVDVKTQNWIIGVTRTTIVTGE